MNVINKIRYRFSREHRVKRLIKEFIKTTSYEKKVKISIQLKNLGLFIGINSTIKENIKFPHPVGIVIGEGAVLGENVTVYQNVTIGQKQDKYPVIGDGCIIYPNSVIFGDVVVGNNSVIGAGTIVNKNVPDNSVVVGNPMKIIS